APCVPPTSVERRLRLGGFLHAEEHRLGPRISCARDDPARGQLHGSRPLPQRFLLLIRRAPDPDAGERGDERELGVGRRHSPTPCGCAGSGCDPLCRVPIYPTMNRTSFGGNDMTTLRRVGLPLAGALGIVVACVQPFSAGTGGSGASGSGT